MAEKETRKNLALEPRLREVRVMQKRKKRKKKVLIKIENIFQQKIASAG